MKKTFLIVSAVLIAFCSAQTLRAQTPTTPDEKAAQPRKTSGIFTMYALDPLARSFCFNDGKEGMRIANHQWGNRCSDLNFSLVSGGTLVAGIEVDRAAVIVDLGTNNELRERYGFDDAENGAVGFASLRLEGNKITVLQEDNTKPVWTTLKEGAALFTETRASANAPIKLGHIYLVRIADSKNQSFRQIAKLMVIAYRPGESVTLRWELLTN
ncbi:MAG TPA: hypothetical protein VN644_07395 [Pyrinomonadaceae bacterium]|jgi:hypothetical protein|nr:hypothetical protein [Pyrinomonadaceae bacterium]